MCWSVAQPQNILLTDALPAGDIKLCDFGLARSFSGGEGVVDAEIVGTLDYVGEYCKMYLSDTLTRGVAYKLLPYVYS